MSTAQKDPRQFISTEVGRDHARKHQIIFPRLLDAKSEIVASKEIRLYQGFEARLHLHVYDLRR